MRARSAAIYACLLAILILAGFFAWRHFFPAPEVVIRRRLNDLAQLLSFGPGEGPLAKVSNAQKATSYFSEDVDIAIDVAGYGMVRVEGHDNLFQALMTARSQLSSVDVQFLDINVVVAGSGDGATVNLTVKGRLPSDRDIQVLELKILVRKVSGKWLIRHVEAVKTLSKVPHPLTTFLWAS
jgi:hypothetical protein